MTNPVDVHILHLPGENEHWWELCKESLKGHPINIHNLDGVVNNMWEGRCRGYRLGTAPYVSFVDPDDIVMPGAFQACLDALESEPEVGGAHTNSAIIDEEGNITRKRMIREDYRMTIARHRVHQIAVMRRPVLEKAMELIEVPDDTIVFADYVIFAHAAMVAPWRFLHITGYQWRQHEGGQHNLIDRKERQRRTKQVFKKLAKIKVEQDQGKV